MGRIILDASAIVAVLLMEPGHELVLPRIAEAGAAGIAAPTLVEAGIVLSARLGGDGIRRLWELLREAEIEILPFTREHVEVALDAFERYGKGCHRAALNYGDCMAYAAAVLAGAPLVFAGQDFLETDLGQS